MECYLISFILIADFFSYKYGGISKIECLFHPPPPPFDNAHTPVQKYRMLFGRST